MADEHVRDHDAHRSRVPTVAAMRARDVSRPDDADLVVAEAEAAKAISARLAGRSQRLQPRGPGNRSVRS
jgi:hypothetical protein